MATGVLIVVTLLLGVGFADAQVLKKEPARGALRFGDRVLVDDGSCPRGQIKEVTGGSNMGRSETRPGRTQRSRRCIARNGR